MELDGPLDGSDDFPFQTKVPSLNFQVPSLNFQVPSLNFQVPSLKISRLYSRWIQTGQSKFFLIQGSRCLWVRR